MARGRSKPTVVNNQLHYALGNGVQYIDVFRDLSALNRKLIRQGRVAYITEMGYTVQGAAAGASGRLVLECLPNDWVHNNAWKKAQAHWLAQQREALKLIGPSAKPTWQDFKVFYDASHRAGTTLAVPSLSYGDWDYSRFVWEADDASIDEPYAHMQGNNVSDTDFGLVLNYQQSRATVQPEDPDVPAEYSTNMYALMAQDENLSLDEVAQNIESTNDEPPYDQDDYPGNDSNYAAGHATYLTATPMTPTVTPSAGVFCAPLGLIKILHQGIAQSDGSVVTAPTAALTFRVAYGNYKGLAAPTFGQ